jgi:hypothetical protein
MDPNILVVKESTLEAFVKGGRNLCMEVAEILSFHCLLLYLFVWSLNKGDYYVISLGIMMVQSYFVIQAN